MMTPKNEDVFINDAKVLMPIGNILKDARKAKRLTQLDVATLLCVNQSSVAQWEKGHRKIDILHFLKITKLLGVNTNMILDHVSIEEWNLALPLSVRCRMLSEAQTCT